MIEVASGKRFGEFLKDNLGFVVAGAAMIVSVILLLLLWSVRAESKASAGRQLISEAERDPLTKLYNHSFFIAYVNRLYREHPDRPMDAVVMNIERFHVLNTLNGREYLTLELRDGLPFAADPDRDFAN